MHSNPKAYRIKPNSLGISDVANILRLTNSLVSLEFQNTEGRNLSVNDAMSSENGD